MRAWGSLVSAALALQTAAVSARTVQHKVSADKGTIEAARMVELEATIVAKVTAVDTATSTVTLVGQKGRSVELEVEPETAQGVPERAAPYGVYQIGEL